MEKHIILSLGRSGSNYLANLFNNHPQITNYGEVLGDWTVPYKLHSKIGLGGKSVEEYLDFIYSNQFFFYAGQVYSAVSHVRKGKEINFKYWQDLKTIGVKDFAFLFIRRNISSYLRERSDILVVNLYRKNILKRFISLAKMNSSGLVMVAKSNQDQQVKRKEKITLDIPHVLKKLEIFDQELRDHKKIVQELPSSQCLNLYYEELFANPKSQSHYANEVLKFLGVEPIDTKSDHRKILSDNLVDIVDNYDDLEQALRDTKFAQYLD